MGRGYVIEHVVSALNIQAKRERYENYIAEALRSIAFNTARQDKVMTVKSYADLIAPKPNADDDVRAEDIINRLKKKLKGG